MTFKSLIGDAPVSRWLDLMVPRFRCGHEKTPANTVDYSGQVRCRTCKFSNDRSWLKRHPHYMRDYMRDYNRERHA